MRFRGNPRRKDRRFCETWKNTVNNLDFVAEAHSETFLGLDETRSASSVSQKPYKSVIEAIVLLDDGGMKGRATDTTATASWFVGALSTSNKSVDEMAAEAGIPVDDAYRDRLIDVPILAFGDGSFQNLHGFEDQTKFASALRNIARANFGRASRRFLKRLVEWRRLDEKGLVAWLEERRTAYKDAAKKRINAQGRDLDRVHERAATIYAAGALGIQFEIFPWKRSELRQSIIACMQAHVDHFSKVRTESSVAKAAPALPINPWKELARYVRENKANFIDLRRGPVTLAPDHDHSMCAGYVNLRSDEKEEYFFSERKLTEILGGNIMLAQLRSDPKMSQWIFRDAKRTSVKRTIGKGGVRASGIAIGAGAFRA